MQLVLAHIGRVLETERHVRQVVDHTEVALGIQQLAQTDAMQLLHQTLRRVLRDGREQGNLHHGGGDGSASRHDNFSQTRNTQRDVHGTVASQMECVQCHLCGRLTDGLTGDDSHRLARIHEGAHVLHPEQHLQTAAVHLSRAVFAVSLGTILVQGLLVLLVDRSNVAADIELPVHGIGKA